MPARRQSRLFALGKIRAPARGGALAERDVNDPAKPKLLAHLGAGPALKVGRLR